MKGHWFSNGFSLEKPRTWKDPTLVPEVGFKVLKKGISLVFNSRAILHEKQTCLSIIKGSKSWRKNKFFYALFCPIFIFNFQEKRAPGKFSASQSERLLTFWFRSDPVTLVRKVAQILYSIVYRWPRYLDLNHDHLSACDRWFQPWPSSTAFDRLVGQSISQNVEGGDKRWEGEVEISSRRLVEESKHQNILGPAPIICNCFCQVGGRE